MQSFIYQSPTEVVFGKDSENQTAHKVKAYGGSRVLIVFGGGSVVKSGLLNRIEESFTAAGIAFASIGGVQPNPRLSWVRNGIEKSLDFGADFILAIGGGSVIDSAKAIAHGSANPETNVWSFWTGEEVLSKRVSR